MYSTKLVVGDALDYSPRYPHSTDDPTADINDYSELNAHAGRPYPMIHDTVYNIKKDTGGSLTLSPRADAANGQCPNNKERTFSTDAGRPHHEHTS